MIDPAKLIIRHSEPDDAEAVRQIYSEEAAFHSSLHMPYPTLTAWQARLAEQLPSSRSLLAALDGQIVGHADIRLGAGPRRQHAASVAIAVAFFSRRIGVGSALLSAAIDLCERWLAVRRIELVIYGDNVAALALAEKFGFQVEGTAAQYAFRDGDYVAAHFLARLRPAIEQETAS